MKTIILPGFSLHNKQWAYDVQSHLGGDVVVHEWKHWTTGNDKDFSEQELTRIVNLIGDSSVNIIGKSVGAYIAVKTIQKIGERQIHKLILCGVSTSPTFIFNSLGIMDPKVVLCFQNAHDPFLSFQAAKIF